MNSKRFYCYFAALIIIPSAVANTAGRTGGASEAFAAFVGLFVIMAIILALIEGGLRLAAKIFAKS